MYGNFVHATNDASHYITPPTVCLSLDALAHYCTDPDVTWGNGRGPTIPPSYIRVPVVEGVPSSCALFSGLYQYAAVLRCGLRTLSTSSSPSVQFNSPATFAIFRMCRIKRRSRLSNVRPRITAQ